MQSDPTFSAWMSASCSHSNVLPAEGAISYRHNSIQASLTLKNPARGPSVLHPCHKVLGLYP